jgi:hypothetical protein
MLFHAPQKMKGDRLEVEVVIQVIARIAANEKRNSANPAEPDTEYDRHTVALNENE